MDHHQDKLYGARMQQTDLRKTILALTEPFVGPRANFHEAVRSRDRALMSAGMAILGVLSRYRDGELQYENVNPTKDSPGLQYIYVDEVKTAMCEAVEHVFSAIGLKSFEGVKQAVTRVLYTARESVLHDRVRDRDEYDAAQVEQFLREWRKNIETLCGAGTNPSGEVTLRQTEQALASALT
jgi:hypothetical protein